MEILLLKPIDETRGSALTVVHTGVTREAGNAETAEAGRRGCGLANAVIEAGVQSAGIALRHTFGRSAFSTLQGYLASAYEQLAHAAWRRYEETIVSGVGYRELFAEVVNWWGEGTRGSEGDVEDQRVEDFVPMKPLVKPLAFEMFLKSGTPPRYSGARRSRPVIGPREVPRTSGPESTCR